MRRNAEIIAGAASRRRCCRHRRPQHRTHTRCRHRIHTTRLVRTVPRKELASPTVAPYADGLANFHSMLLCASCRECALRWVVAIAGYSSCLNLEQLFLGSASYLEAQRMFVGGHDRLRRNIALDEREKSVERIATLIQRLTSFRSNLIHLHV